jgi:hypothetical protein
MVAYRRTRSVEIDTGERGVAPRREESRWPSGSSRPAAVMGGLPTETRAGGYLASVLWDLAGGDRIVAAFILPDA